MTVVHLTEREMMMMMMMEHEKKRKNAGCGCVHTGDDDLSYLVFSCYFCCFFSLGELLKGKTCLSF